MSRILSRINNFFVLFGVDFRKTIRSIRGLPYYFRDLRILRKGKKFGVCEFSFGKPYPCLDDRFINAGSANGHYFHQDLLVARRIYANKPNVHVDIGSRVDGFVAHVASFRTIEVIDIRTLPNEILNISFIQADLMAPIADDLIECCDSLSCLHAMEHFGLGRYGDPVKYDGYLLGINNLHRILKQNGKLYFSVPIGPQRIEFNAHRVFSISYLKELFEGKYQIDQFSYVDDNGDLHENTLISDSGCQNNFGCIFGCGIFEMTKL